MFYCDPCAEKNDWPKSIGRSQGACELCGQVAICNDVPSRQLPLPKKTHVTVILFKPTGKYYTEEMWRLPESVPMDGINRHHREPSDPVPTRKVVGPYDMIHSPDFRRIDGGAVLVISQEPWGFPHLFNAEPGALEAWQASFSE